MKPVIGLSNKQRRNLSLFNESVAGCREATEFEKTNQNPNPVCTLMIFTFNSVISCNRRLL